MSDEIDVLQIAVNGLEDPARQIGLYLQDWQPHDTPAGLAAVVAFDIGDVAFSKRVQDPVEADIDAEFRTIALDAQTDEWLDARSAIVANLAAGRDPFDEPDGWDGSSPLA